MTPRRVALFLLVCFALGALLGWLIEEEEGLPAFEPDDWDGGW